MDDEIGQSFEEFIRRIRAGDERAAEELVRQFEPLIRREIRLQLASTELDRLLDSVDVSQSVLASFFLRAAAGQYDLDNPQQLARLLVTMARNKIASRVRWEYRKRRDARRTERDGAVVDSLPDNDPMPCEIVATREIWQRFRDGLTADEIQIADLRGQGLPWKAIAEQIGGSAQSRRMQLVRAIDRVCQQLGLAEDPS
jgi:RNA polymerase sigma factor (sigma-70 family)